MKKRSSALSRAGRCALAGALVFALAPSAAMAAEVDDREVVSPSVIELLAEDQSTAFESTLMTNNLGFILRSSQNAEGAKRAYAAYGWPAQYDLRDFGVVTPVKQQSPWGTCWGFAAIAAAETSILSDFGATYDTFPLDLSELQLAWFSQTALPEGYYAPDEPQYAQAGEGSYATDPDPNQRLNTGGMPFTATSIFSSGIGPTSEFDVPYRNVEGIEATIRLDYGEEIAEQFEQQGVDPDAGLGYYSATGDWSVPESQRFVQAFELEESNILPSPCTFELYTRDDGVVDQRYVYNEAGTIAIKSELMNGRAVQIAFAADQSMPGQVTELAYMNPETWSHYTYQGAGANHAVTVVGWDDDYAVSNFTEGHEPPAPGAWIVKNSWGAQGEEFPHQSDWGLDGYFYLSYYDQSLAEPESLDFSTEDYGNTSGMYFVAAHDYMPSTRVVSATTNDETRMANVFTAESALSLRSVATETSAPFTTVTYQVYLLDDDAQDPTDGTMASEISATYEYAGFHQTDLYGPVVMGEGQKYAIVVTQRTASGSYQMLTESAINKAGIDGIQSALGWQLPTYCKAVVNEGESFYYSQGVWRDWTEGIDELRQEISDSTEPGVIDTSMWSDYDNFAIKAYADPVSAAEIYPDVAQDAWYADSVSYVTASGIMTGFADDGLFHPDESMTRGHMAAMLFKYLAPEEHAKYDEVAEFVTVANETNLSDVRSGEWYTAAVNWCVDQGYITGYDGLGLFGVDDPVTREQVATILMRISPDQSFDITTSLGEYSDRADVDEWAVEGMLWAVGNGIIIGADGVDSLTLKPLRHASRAEVAEMLYRFDSELM